MKNLALFRDYYDLPNLFLFQLMKYKFLESTRNANSWCAFFQTVADTDDPIHLESLVSSDLFASVHIGITLVRSEFVSRCHAL